MLIEKIITKLIEILDKIDMWKRPHLDIDTREGGDKISFCGRFEIINHLKDKPEPLLKFSGEIDVIEGGIYIAHYSGVIELLVNKFDLPVHSLVREFIGQAVKEVRQPYIAESKEQS